jgi:hypothetical protein
MTKTRVFFLSVLCLAIATDGLAQAEIIELACPSCGYRQQFRQGADPLDQSRNVQQIIVVCERSGQIRNIAIPLDPRAPVTQEPLLGREQGTGTSKLLGVELPKFLVPGNTCPLFPVTAYLEANICPIDGMPGIHYAVVGQY